MFPKLDQAKTLIDNEKRMNLLSYRNSLYKIDGLFDDVNKFFIFNEQLTDEIIEKYKTYIFIICINNINTIDFIKDFKIYKIVLQFLYTKFNRYKSPEQKNICYYFNDINDINMKIIFISIIAIKNNELMKKIFYDHLLDDIKDLKQEAIKNLKHKDINKETVDFINAYLPLL